MTHHNESGHCSTGNDTLGRCAELLAVDEIEWPNGLTSAQEAELAAAVRRLRQRRLIRLVASCIAADIAHEATQRAQEAQR